MDYNQRKARATERWFRLTGKSELPKFTFMEKVIFSIYFPKRIKVIWGKSWT